MLEASRQMVLPARPLAPGRSRRLALFRSPLATAGLVLLAVMVFLALLAPLLPLANPLAQTLSQRLRPPSLAHPLGTDQLGRDILSRLIFGARLSLMIGLVVVSTAGTLGTTVGLIAGYRGGLADEVLMRITDIFFAFPPLILAMAIAGALGPSLTNTMIAIAVVSWPVYARLVRGEVLALKEREYIQAARSVGVPTARLLWRHLLPNATAPILVTATFDMGNAILAAAGLSFIGFGARPPTPEWGVMISEGRQYISTQAWLSIFPGIAILLVVTAFNLLGDGLRDALDPQLG
jgi:peptide/nickel transport system permease protein